MTTKTNLAQPTYNSLNWDSPLNSNFGIINNSAGGNASLNASSNYSMSASEAQNAMIVVSNSSGATRSIATAGVTGTWMVFNNSANDLNVYATAYSGAAVTIQAGYKGAVFSPDGANMYEAGSNNLVKRTGDTMTGALALPSNGLNVGSGQLQVSGGNVYATGQFFSNSNITAFNTSDARLKENVETIPNALTINKMLRGVTYTMKKDGSPGVGLIAQELQKVLPQLVAEDEEGTMYVAYANLVAVLINAVNELSERVEALEAK